MNAVAVAAACVQNNMYGGDTRLRPSINTERESHPSSHQRFNFDKHIMTSGLSPGTVVFSPHEPGF